MGGAGGAATETNLPTPQTWQPRAALPTSRSELGAAVLGDRVYLAGGFGDTDAFDAYLPDRDTWERLARMPAGRDHCAITAHDGAVYVFGGSRTDTAWRYDVALDAWSDLADMPFDRSSSVAVSLGTFVYVVAGTGAVAQSLLRYDPAANEWQPLAELSILRDHSAAVVLDGKIYSLGGRMNSNTFHNSVEIYDVDSDAWSAGPAMNSVRSGFGAVVWRDHIIACGGEVRLNGDGVALDSCEALPPGGTEWQPWPTMPRGIHGVAMANYQDRLFILGGSLQFFSAVNSDAAFELIFQ